MAEDTEVPGPAPTENTKSPSYMGRILNLLEQSVVAEGAPLTLTELAAAAQAPLSTVSRLTAQLVAWGFLNETTTHRFVPGRRLAAMAAAVSEHLYSNDRLQQATRLLTGITGESTTAGRIVGNSMFIIARTESEQPLRAVNRIGEFIPPDNSALGKAIMSRLPRARQLALLRGADVADPEATLEKILPELEEARRRGYAVDEETYSVGLRCRAAAVIGPDGLAVAGLSISGPAARFTLDLAEGAVPALRQEASAIGEMR
ncbi:MULTISPECIES: IclR family transcriptional regulator [unclassified Streptomyces]|uniref:IclR family transcriptional regulator n=1 Tax=unclassified Streptomyces TaxID=2593676 RepID=UPI002E33C226|nr:IclR family transcriptional regulator [Streptomyces sp. NBC_01716]